MSSYRRTLLAVLAVALLACTYVVVWRVHREQQARRVEITMDYNDFVRAARSFGYNEDAFLVQLRRAGLTSLALSEELGSSLGTSSDAFALSGQALLNEARLSTLAEPALTKLVRSGAVRVTDLYVVVYNAETYRRYRRELPLRFAGNTVRYLTVHKPWIIAIRTQPDFFGTTALGIPDEQFAVAQRLGFIADPRLQNEERFDQPRIDAIFNTVAAHRRVGTVIFFGLRNEVMGNPDHFDAAADAFKRTKLIFGSIEAYDKLTLQKGTEGLARLIPAQTTRVQAIAATELDKIDPETVIARYLLGVRERNVRVLYVRPFPHMWNGRSIEATNIEIVRRLRDGLLARGFKLGRATPVQPLGGGAGSLPVIAIASLAVPAIVLLILDALGYRRRRVALVLLAADLMLVAAGFLVHHDMAVRKLLALTGGILFPVAATLAIAPYFRARAATTASFAGAFLAGVRALAISVGITVIGGVVVVGLLSTALTMEEIDRFTGVKAVLLVPPLIVLALYWCTPRFGAQLENLQSALASPVRVAQMLLLAIILGTGYLLLTRSGNQSDIAPSAFELALRSDLTAWLSVRPRFKEVLLGFPLLMLLPSLIAADRRAFGWLAALGVGVGLADVVDTFSHLHTPLSVSLVRVLLGLVVGLAVGTPVLLAYRALRPGRP